MEERIKARIEALEAEAAQLQADAEVRVAQMSKLVDQHNQYLVAARQRLAGIEASVSELQTLLEGNEALEKVAA